MRINYIYVSLALIFIIFLGYFKYPNHSAYPVRGLDLSHHQGQIRWESVSAKMVDFVYLKATEGGDFRDREFARNWIGAGERKINRGAYHFFTFCTSGKKQAENFIATVGESFGEIPPAIDIEYGGNCKKRLSDEQLSAELASFNAVIKDVWGVSPIYYVTRDIYADYPKAFSAHRLWGRAIMTPPSRTYEQEWDLWQFSSFGRVQGIDGRVDQNVFRGSHDDFEAWIEVHKEKNKK